ncbi:Protein N-methyltransferase NNT1 [Saitozyma sp. JCM 24511]|nr:Protein N-methyltransferase NNT1 [Saitozyma sp. JCM 24511]
MADQSEASSSKLPTSSRLTDAAGLDGFSDDDDQGVGFGLDDLLPEPESPLPAPYSFATFDVPAGVDLDLGEGRTHILTRLVGAHPLWGHYLWNTAKVLSTYLLRHTGLIQGNSVLELGAGAGLPSIIAALAGAQRVVVTDYPDASLVENLRYNVDMNVPEDRRGRIREAGHLWGHDVEALLKELDGVPSANSDGKYDLLLLSDLVFNHSQHPALISTVNSLLSHSPAAPPTTNTPASTPCILVFFTHHRPHLVAADMAFFPRLAESGTGWAYEKVVEEWAGVMFEEDPGDERVRGTVHGWRAWRVREGEEAGERKGTSSAA